MLLCSVIQENNKLGDNGNNIAEGGHALGSTAPPPLLQAMRSHPHARKNTSQGQGGDAPHQRSICCFVCAAKEGNENGESIPAWDLSLARIHRSSDWLSLIFRGCYFQQRSLMQKQLVAFTILVLTGSCLSCPLLTFAMASQQESSSGSGSGPYNLAAKNMRWISVTQYYLRIVSLCSVSSVLLLILFCAGNTLLQLHNIKKRRQAQDTKFQHSSEIKQEYDIPKDRLLSTANQEAYAKTLSRAIQIPTVSHDYQTSDEETSEEHGATLLQLHQLLKERFPHLHQEYPPTIINKHSLLFKIPQRKDYHHHNKAKKLLDPILLCAHLDVVPAPNDNDEWTHDPFGGWIDEHGVIWGRGAIDNKHNVVSMMAALEDIIKHKELPPRPVYLALGHDEEIGGSNGAAEIARHLKDTVGCMAFDFVLDEGTMMVSGAIPGVDKKKHVAMICTTEKGYTTVELGIQGPGGHTSIPALDNNTNTLAIMARAIDKLESNPMPAHFEPGSLFRKSLESMLDHYKSFVFQCIFGNLWLFGPLIKQVVLKANPAAAAMIRTTTATVKLSGGTKFNVMPTEVKAFVNHRVHPSDTMQRVLEHDRRVINDPRIKVSLVEGQHTPAAPIAQSSNGSPFALMEQCVSRVYGRPSAPSLMIGNTDTRWYWDLSLNIYRFSPVALTMADTAMFHGINERISTNALAEMVLFYRTLIINSANQR
jgi:carboxypeptidase PM20D1